MKFIDTHCHVDLIANRLESNCNFVINDLPENCEAIVHSTCEPKDLDFPEQILLKVDKLDKVWFCAGIHPHNASEYNEEIHQKIITLMSHPKCLGWGEIGLDYHYDLSPRDIQQKVFAKQLKEAAKMNLAIVIHAREADDDMFRILNEHLNENHKVHIHCYTNTALYAKKLLGLKAKTFFGFTGAVTFKNSQEIREALKVIPLNRILLETDAPYMAPIPFRGKCAHSGMIPNIVEVIAETLKESPANIYKYCRQNTKEFYGI